VANSDVIDHQVAHNYSEPMRLPFAAERTARLMRWSTMPRPTRAQLRFGAAVAKQSSVPVLQVQTDCDPVIRWTVTPVPELGGDNYRFELLRGLGHLPAEEDGRALAAAILNWAAEEGI
jgi:pimeloyl-ACP methyl ester carboxylesterase